MSSAVECLRARSGSADFCTSREYALQLGEKLALIEIDVDEPFLMPLARQEPRPVDPFHKSTD